MDRTRISRLTFGAGGYRATIKPGELVLPAVVVLFGAYYYFSTRGLPGRSVVYAHPLLYVTLFFAVLVVGTHAVDVTTEETLKQGAGVPSSASGTNSGTGNIEESTAKEASSRTTTTEENDGPAFDEYFNRYTAAGLVVLSLGYYQLIQLFGFLAPTIAFCGVVLYMFGERNLLALLGYSVGFSVTVFVVFGYWLNVPIEPFVLPV